MSADKKAELLTPRLRSVGDLLAEGYSRKEIAKRLDLSMHTVNGYVKHLYALFGVHKHIEFVIVYLKFKEDENDA